MYVYMLQLYYNVITINNVIYQIIVFIINFNRNLKFIYINTIWPTVSPLTLAHFCIV